MAAPIGNQFWKQRESHGRKGKFATPEDMWEAACEYFDWCDNNPLISYEWNGKDPVKCELEKMRAYTLQGLCVFLDVAPGYFNQITDNDFSSVVTRIKNVCYTQKFEGAAAGLLNPNIIARDLGLVDKSEINPTGSGIKVIIGKEPENNGD